MPGPLDGRDLARRARARLPNIAVLFTPGYAEDTMITESRLATEVKLLPKPYTREALADKIRRTLAASKHKRAGAPVGRPDASAARSARPVLRPSLADCR